MLPNLKPNFYGCRKLYFSFAGCRKAKKVGNHCIIELLQSIYFAYEVGIISSSSNRICYRKIAKSRTKDTWELHAALRTVFENHFLSSNITHANYDVTALAIILNQRNIKGLQIPCCSLVS